MTTPFMFLTCVISDPKNPKNKIDVYWQPLIDELKELWEVGVKTYDVSTGHTFQMKVALMWTINECPAYGMLSGWTTNGQLVCPVFMKQQKGLRLRNGGKFSCFDCRRCFLLRNHAFRRIVIGSPPRRLFGEELYAEVEYYPMVSKNGDFVILGFKKNEYNWTKKSIFWELPYCQHQLLRHNLNVMHIEQNFFKNIINTIMDLYGKTKDNAKSRMDVAEVCDRPELH